MVDSLRGSITGSVISSQRRQLVVPLDVDSQYKIAKKKELIVKKLEQLRKNNFEKES